MNNSVEIPDELLAAALANGPFLTVEERAQLSLGEPAPQCDLQASRILIVDDEPLNVKVAQKYLRTAGYQHFASTNDSRDVLSLVERERPDLVLLDLMMPYVSGLDVLRSIRERPEWAKLPVIILTALSDQQVKASALEAGATDFLTKPVEPAELLPRVRNVLAAKAYQDHLRGYATDLERQVRRRTAELVKSRLELLNCLAKAAEYRDNETGRHVIRVGRYVGMIARKLGLPPEQCELLSQAAPLHDLGKIGIPDEILLKPGKLDPEEYERMQRHVGYGRDICSRMSGEEWSAFTSHTSVGAAILYGVTSPVLKLAASIALTHHEKWDGTGYPLGLAGEDIPLEGRITAVADVFDALSSRRPYKPPFPLEKCFTILEEQRGQHFDPQVLDAFLASRSEVVQVQIEYADT